jgi:hypothetical protein
VVAAVLSGAVAVPMALAVEPPAGSAAGALTAAAASVVIIEAPRVPNVTTRLRDAPQSWSRDRERYRRDHRVQVYILVPEADRRRPRSAERFVEAGPDFRAWRDPRTNRSFGGSFDRYRARADDGWREARPYVVLPPPPYRRRTD